MELARLHAGMRDKTVLGLVSVTIVAASTIVSLIPSEWSFIDDSQMKAGLVAHIERQGFLGGILGSIQSLASADASWGLFRPLWYVYASIFYLTDPGLAHGLRMAMFLLAITIPALHVGRRLDGSRDYALSIWAAALLLLNAQLFQGLSFLSLQELTGVTFVALGVGTLRPGLRSLAFLAAAWTKAPFAWLLLAYGCYLLLEKRSRRQGALAVTTGSITIVMAVLAAKHGIYTKSYDVSITHMLQTVRASLTLFAWPTIGGLLGIVLLRLKLRTLRWDAPMFRVVLIGGLGYFATLLPWGVTAYYGAPVIYLLSVAGLFLLSSSATASVEIRRPAVAIALSLVVLAAIRMTFLMGTIQYQRNQTVVEIRNWAASLPSAGLRIGINGPEAAARLQEIMAMRKHTWANSVVYVSDNEKLPIDYYIQLDDQGSGNVTEELRLEARLSRATIWESRAVDQRKHGVDPLVRVSPASTAQAG